MSRVLDPMAVAGLLFCWLALPAAADGLSRFEEAMKQAPAGTLTYKSAKALGDNGFVLEGVVVTPPPDKTPGAKAEPVEIKRIAVEDFDFAAVDKKAPPNFARVRVEGIVIGAKPAEGIDLAELAGIDKISADFQLDYRLDPERKTMTLNRLELDLNGLARIARRTGNGDARRARRARLLSRRLPAAERAVARDPQPAGKDLRRRDLRHDDPGRGYQGLGAGGLLCRHKTAGGGKAGHEGFSELRRQGRLRTGSALFRHARGRVVVGHGARSLQIGRSMHRPDRWRRRRRYHLWAR